MKKTLTLLILVFVATSMFAQRVNLNEGSIRQKNYIETIPYRTERGWIIVPVTIDKKTYNFLFDTGAPLMISDKLYKELNPQTIGQVPVADAMDVKKEMKIISLPELHLQGITFINTAGFVGHEESSDSFNAFDAFECLGIDGIIGSNMLRNSVVQFDGQSKQIIITNDAKNLSLNNNTSRKMKLSPVQSNPYIRVFLRKDNKRVWNELLFDTGDVVSFYTMSMRAYQFFSRRVNVLFKMAESEGAFGVGMHGVADRQQHLLLNIPKFIVNKTTFNDVVVSTTYRTDSRIGAKLLQYGKATLDYKKKRFYFEPFHDISTNEVSEKPWQFQPVWENGKMVVGIIWDKALESQINLGDEILSVNGIDYQSMDFCEILKLDDMSSGKEMTVELRDIITGEIKKIEIKRMQINK